SPGYRHRRVKRRTRERLTWQRGAERAATTIDKDLYRGCMRARAPVDRLTDGKRTRVASVRRSRWLPLMLGAAVVMGVVGCNEVAAYPARSHCFSGYLRRNRSRPGRKRSPGSALSARQICLSVFRVM